MRYEAVIGLEVHAQMLTDTKIFCGCSTKFGSEPNTQTCPVCIGMPGVLPVLNKKALEFTIKTGLAMKCRISPYSRFARKNYFYPDLPKGYQISQYELPICEHGYTEIVVDGNIKKVGITRIHMEEDAGKNIHEGTGNYSFVDLNRAGVPLMEIVSEPDIRSSGEAVEYMKKLRTILRYLGVCDGNMEQGSLRCDANVSVRSVGQKEYGIRTEVKNINSFKFVEKALEYEIKRQIRVIEEEGGINVSSTRLWDASRGITESMRVKEEAHDYRYFPEPDLVPIMVEQEWIDKIKSSLPELPGIKMERFVSVYGFPEEDADFLTSEKALADWFEDAVKLGGQPKAVSNWIMSDLLRLLNVENKSIEECPLKPKQLVSMLNLIENGTISGKIAKTVFEEMYKSSRGADVIVKEKGLVQISDAGSLEKVVDEVIAKNPKEVERFKAGEEKLIGFFVGQVMKLTKGKANPQMVNELLKKRLSA
ncbi:MAG: Asp-tRNA(Asn)/Glu-tRNA(Gln) amidotransferase GatCAB subunit B [Nitrospirae bacterium CG_4_10_14_0_8_um_filter_41_23]|nr:Asp-tRNA(Asn)/Glu-tRNA(Gln) amidotransferase subunit GatB [Nitrospirota bacterium]OIP58942.1 MAG: aspartyl/glutamyl-tRNA amidotransferase subunit B [Nitrospirae bacterium CG2_30_41_42]PIQ94132.1 MAG: Asp-tRNA(Asn)/Glu-tRNA(Gln) amidotransferase GatCAB subunit B [Nitrospirae bacterium CG11_big_fil_rev_8_21_14_0_20_41_14]PIV43142.1 MAG: Asp-tRNA(Asn)/Glu-tRNA(Gln) amidotransferase GatCAB subunit B [Nitrospirae bacterium CG02_land_8_20_14_3_00_41_53]PIW87813.1 MAG: Asp-tRNA(Asn)/Glu-tRNA(Gln) a